jgi:ATP-dependent helicase HrpA
VSNGICYRLYSEEDFNSRPAFTDPEIVRTNLAAVILQMLHLRIGDIRSFPFVDPPDNRMISDGFKLLEELQAVNGSGKLTTLGKKLVSVPLDPRFARMIMQAAEIGSLSEVMIITSGLSIQDPRERPADKQQAADQAHAQWRDPDSDFMSLLNVWRHFETKRQELSGNQYSKYCRANYVSFLRMKEWRDLHHQVHSACRALKFKENQKPAEYAAIHQALLSGLLGQVGIREDKWEFAGTRNRKFFIFPGSGLSKKPPKWVMAGSLMETAKQYALNVAKIDSDWLAPLAAHLVKKNLQCTVLSNEIRAGDRQRAPDLIWPQYCRRQKHSLRQYSTSGSAADIYTAGTGGRGLSGQRQLLPEKPAHGRRASGIGRPLSPPGPVSRTKSHLQLL